jgi:hypothetical protein
VFLLCAPCAHDAGLLFIVPRVSLRKLVDLVGNVGHDLLGFGEQPVVRYILIVSCESPHFVSLLSTGARSGVFALRSMWQ